MVYRAMITARHAENDRFNAPGMCLQVNRIWAGIDALYPTAGSAWEHTNHRFPGDRHPGRGAMVFWTGGSAGAGHIATCLGTRNGTVYVRSTDSGGEGRVATVPLHWVEQNWHLHYGGWAWDINEVTIPHKYWDRHHHR